MNKVAERETQRESVIDKPQEEKDVTKSHGKQKQETVYPSNR